MERRNDKNALKRVKKKFAILKYYFLHSVRIASQHFTSSSRFSIFFAQKIADDERILRRVKLEIAIVELMTSEAQSIATIVKQ